jgi:hypothetical protein
MADPEVGATIKKDADPLRQQSEMNVVYIEGAGGADRGAESGGRSLRVNTLMKSAARPADVLFSRRPRPMAHGSRGAGEPARVNQL